MISVLIVDDHSIVREGLRRVIESEMDIKVCAETDDGRDVLDLVGAHQPDIVILDINMPQLSGLETLELIRSKHPQTKVIFLSVRSDTQVVHSAIHLGADGFLLKNTPGGKIVEAIREVKNGGNFFSPEIQRYIIHEARNPRTNESEPFDILSRREREVLRLLASGNSSKEIATSLHISTKTVEAHRTNLMRKVGVRKSTELVRYAIKHGLIEA